MTDQEFQQLQNELYDIGILCIAEELHSNRWGSSDSYALWCQPEGTKEKHLAYLKEKLKRWRPSASPHWEQFDNAVKSVITAAIAEWEQTPGSKQ
jgi:hypothetical protein